MVTWCISFYLVLCFDFTSDISINPALFVKGLVVFHSFAVRIGFYV